MTPSRPNPDNPLGIPGAKVVSYNIAYPTFRDANEAIRAAMATRSTGSLTIHFSQGHATATEWKGRVKD